MSKGRIWPYAIGAAITLVFSFCIMTIFVTESTEIQESDMYMAKYQVADFNANKLINQKIAFDKLYNISYITKSIAGNAPTISYKITTKDGKAVNKATIKIAISRPDTDKYDASAKNPSVNNGIYSFKLKEFTKAGVWNFIAKINIDDKERFFNIKADTRSSYSYEF